MCFLHVQGVGYTSTRHSGKKVHAAKGECETCSRKQATELQPTNGELELIRIDMLNEKECAEVLSVVHDLIGYKIGTRLGAASYKMLPVIGRPIDKYWILIIPFTHPAMMTR